MGSGFDVDINEYQQGILPRAIHHLFDGIKLKIENAHVTCTLPPEFKLSVQFMELYNEEVIDLLNPVFNRVSSHKNYFYIDASRRFISGESI